MATLPNKHYSGRRRAIDIEDNQRTRGRDMQKEMWTAGFRYSWRKMTVEELDKDKWSVDYAPPGATSWMEKSSLWTMLHWEQQAGWRQVVCGLCSTGSNKLDGDK